MYSINWPYPAELLILNGSFSCHSWSPSLSQEPWPPLLTTATREDSFWALPTTPTAPTTHTMAPPAFSPEVSSPLASLLPESSPPALLQLPASLRPVSLLPASSLPNSSPLSGTPWLPRVSSALHSSAPHFSGPVSFDRVKIRISCWFPSQIDETLFDFYKTIIVFKTYKIKHFPKFHASSFPSTRHSADMKVQGPSRENPGPRGKHHGPPVIIVWTGLDFQSLQIIFY